MNGARQVRAKIPDAVSVFILPPSRAALEERMRKRGQDSEDVIRQRLARLARPTSRMLSLASISGREFNLDVVERVGDLSGGAAAEED